MNGSGSSARDGSGRFGPAFAWALVAVWCGLIFWGSTDTLSAAHTSRFLTPFLHWLVPSMSDDAIETVRMVIRKGGHVTEYLVLATLLWRALRTSARPHATPEAGAAWSARTAAWAWALATLYAASDEFHQSFYASRQASVLDVGIDSCGALAGVFLCRVAWRLARRRRGSR